MLTDDRQFGNGKANGGKKKLANWQNFSPSVLQKVNLERQVCATRMAVVMLPFANYRLSFGETSRRNGHRQWRCLTRDPCLQLGAPVWPPHDVSPRSVPLTGHCACSTFEFATLTQGESRAETKKKAAVTGRPLTDLPVPTMSYSKMFSCALYNAEKNGRKGRKTARENCRVENEIIT